MPKPMFRSIFLLFSEGFSTKRGICILALTFPVFNPLQAQLIITSPVNHQIIQRDSGGQASIPITAYANYPYTRIEITLTSVEGNPNQGQRAVFAEEQIKQGFLNTSLKAKTGWYRLTLTGYGPGEMVDSSVVARTGVGEVFLVGGNSNAMGLPELGSKNASDQVISFHALNKSLNTENITIAPDQPMPAPAFTPLKDKNSIFPSGETSWYWAELGDMLSKRMNTPVLFFNTAWAAANSENYRDGALGKDAYNLYVGKNWPNRQPYSNIKNTLRYYHSWLGIRAVLWAHGENDAQLAFTEENYFSNIKTVIEKSRHDAGHNMPWIIATNSASATLATPYLPVTRAQKRLSVLPNFNTYAGPDLDTVQIPRPPHGHFENIAGGKQGLTQVALSWNRVLSDSLISKINPLTTPYAIHTGVVPSGTFPGAVFPLPYQVTGKTEGKWPIHAELLDASGKFVDTVGRSSTSPVTVHLPANLKNGNYRIRVVRSDTILPGSVSALFYLDKAYRSTKYVSSLKARPTGQEIHISWLVAAHPQLQRMILQKTTNGETYTDLASFEAVENENQSHLYSYIDRNLGESSIFYRLLMQHRNGESDYSTVITVFQEGAPPQFVVFPNPVTRQQFYLRSDQGQSIIRCSIVDNKGREHPVSFNDREVIGLIAVRPLYDLPAGNYILRIETDTHVTSQAVLFL
jgi:hypothetical protein